MHQFAPNWLSHFATPLEDGLSARMLRLTVCLLALLYKACKNAAGTDPMLACVPFQIMKNTGVTDRMLVCLVTVQSHNMPPIGLGAQGSPRTGQESRLPKKAQDQGRPRPENSKWHDKDGLQAHLVAPLPKPRFLGPPRPAGPRRTLKAMG